MNAWKLTTFVLGSALAITIGTSSIGTVSADEKKPAEQLQPNMKKALDELEDAKEALKKATPDKGGHRVKAIKLINQAVDEVNLGIKWDNENKSKDEKKK